MNPTMKYLNSLKWGIHLRGDRLHFKIRTDADKISDGLRELIAKHPLEVKTYTTKEQKIIFGGVIWSGSDLANHLQIVYGD